MRQTRAALLEVLREQYILTARSKGLQEKRVILRHAMKNSLLPVVTIASLQLGGLVGGTVVTETVFTLPGVGKFVVDAVIQRDYLVVQMGLLILTVGVMFANFAADIIYTYLDPRIRYD
jgi:peptide/nickel transport system permease protein